MRMGLLPPAWKSPQAKEACEYKPHEFSQKSASNRFVGQIALGPEITLAKGKSKEVRRREKRERKGTVLVEVDECSVNKNKNRSSVSEGRCVIPPPAKRIARQRRLGQIMQM